MSDLPATTSDGLARASALGTRVTFVLDDIESVVYREQTIGVADVGKTWAFEFDAKLGNLEGQTTAIAFIKTLDPNNGFALTNFITVDMTSIPVTWQRYTLTIAIDAGLAGQLLQIDGGMVLH